MASSLILTENDQLQVKGDEAIFKPHMRKFFPSPLLKYSFSNSGWKCARKNLQSCVEATRVRDTRNDVCLLFHKLLSIETAWYIQTTALYWDSLIYPDYCALLRQLDISKLLLSIETAWYIQTTALYWESLIHPDYCSLLRQLDTSKLLPPIETALYIQTTALYWDSSIIQTTALYWDSLIYPNYSSLLRQLDISKLLLSIETARYIQTTKSLVKNSFKASLLIWATQNQRSSGSLPFELWLVKTSTFTET
jgi:hypothetical protein